jgi:ABC-type Fe3+-siderophore transport system permease subunit
MDILTVLMERISATAVILILALASFILQILLRRFKVPPTLTRILSAVGAVLAVYTLIRPISAIFAIGASPLSIATTHIPAALTSLAIAVHFVVLFLYVGDSTKRITVDSTLWAATISTLYLALVVFNFIRTFGNYANGQPELFYIQIVLTALPVFPPLFFWLSYRSGRKVTGQPYSS